MPSISKQSQPTIDVKGKAVWVNHPKGGMVKLATDDIVKVYNNMVKQEEAFDKPKEQKLQGAISRFRRRIDLSGSFD